jgi:mannose-6-phosphate isomerase class I
MVIDVVIRDLQSKKSIHEGPIEVDLVHSFQPINLYLKAETEEFHVLRVHQVMNLMFSHKSNGTKIVFHADGYVVLNNEDGLLNLVIGKSYCFINNMFDANYVAESLFPIDGFENFYLLEYSKGNS